jgi:hypothetical protein
VTWVKHRTPGMKEHLAPVVRYIVRLRFDIRTPKQKLEDEKQEEKHRRWAVVQLASRYECQKPVSKALQLLDMSTIDL